MILSPVTCTIPIMLFMDMMVTMVPKEEVIVALQMIHMELAHRAPHLQSQKEDICITDILKEPALGKVQGAISKWLKSSPLHMSWNNVNAVLG